MAQKARNIRKLARKLPKSRIDSIVLTFPEGRTLIARGITPKELHRRGWSPKKILESGFSLAQMIAYGIPLPKFGELGYKHYMIEDVAVADLVKHYSLEQIASEVSGPTWGSRKISRFMVAAEKKSPYRTTVLPEQRVQEIVSVFRKKIGLGKTVEGLFNAVDSDLSRGGSVETLLNGIGKALPPKPVLKAMRSKYKAEKRIFLLRKIRFHVGGKFFSSEYAGLLLPEERKALPVPHIFRGKG